MHIRKLIYNLAELFPFRSNILFVIWNGIFPPVYSGKLILSQTLTNPSFTQYGRLCANIHFHNKRPKYNMKSLFEQKNQWLKNIVN